jgi:predicted RNA-binding Zn ribbon-like protein
MSIRPHGAGHHEHEIDLAGALAFLNTRGFSADGELVEHFLTPSDPAAWLRDRGLIHAPEARGWTAADLDRTRKVRGALRDLVDSTVEGRVPGGASIRIVNDVLDVRPRHQLELEDGAVRLGHRHVATPAAEALVPIADVIVDELMSGRPDRFRICANDRCRWTFFDASPTGRRRWCEMATCGNRAKAARHRARVKAEATPGAAAEA